MMGCLTWWKCLVACLFFEESQQPTCPHSRHSRRCTQVSPISRHSLQPLPLGVTFLISFWCVQVLAMIHLMFVLPPVHRARRHRSQTSGTSSGRVELER